MEDFRVLDNSLLKLFSQAFFLLLFKSRKNNTIDLSINVQMFLMFRCLHYVLSNYAIKIILNIQFHSLLL